MLSSIANIFRQVAAKKNMIYHFKLEFPLSQMKVDTIAEELRVIQNTEQSTIALSLNASRGTNKHYLTLYEQFRRVRKEAKIPIHCFLEDQVTTEGYMLACCGDTITANPFSVVGDIGSYTSFINISKFLKKYNIEYQNLGLSKGLFNVYTEPVKQPQAQMLVDSLGKLVVKTVSQRRGIPITQVQRIRGKLFNAQQALDLKLIDRVGTYPKWKANQNKDSQQFSIGHTSFQFNITVLQMSSADAQQMDRFLQTHNVIPRIVELLSSRSGDQQLMQFMDRQIMPVLLGITSPR